MEKKKKTKEEQEVKSNFLISRTLMIDRDLFQELKLQALNTNVSWSKLAREYILEGVIRNRI